MKEFFLQYGQIFYALYIAIMQSTSVCVVAGRHLHAKSHKKTVFFILAVVLTVHDLFWSVFGYSAPKKIIPAIEIALLCFVVGILMKKYMQGRVVTDFMHLFAIEWVYQMFLTVFTFPLFMVLAEFNMEKVAQIMDTPSLKNVIGMFFLYIVSYFVTRMVWKFFCKHRNKYFEIVLAIFCVLDIGALILYGWRIIAAVFLACIYIVFTSFRRHNQNEKHLREQFAFYQDLAEKQAKREKEISIIRHDIANHMNVMEEMQKDAEGQELLRKLDKANRSMTGIPVLDCLIREKASVCEKKGIAFEREGGAIGETKITEYEFVSLFANLLDNAIEAAKETEEKTVKLSVEKQQGVLKITVSNSKLAERKPLENDFKTTKKDKKNHGLGSRIVRDIVEVHGGRVSYYDDGEQMRVVALMQE